MIFKGLTIQTRHNHVPGSTLSIYYLINKKVSDFGCLGPLGDSWDDRQEAKLI